MCLSQRRLVGRLAAAELPGRQRQGNILTVKNSHTRENSSLKCVCSGSSAAGMLFELRLQNISSTLTTVFPSLVTFHETQWMHITTVLIFRCSCHEGTGVIDYVNTNLGTRITDKLKFGDKTVYGLICCHPLCQHGSVTLTSFTKTGCTALLR